MDNQRFRGLFLFAGVSGIAGTCCYIVAATVTMSDNLTYVVAMAWPLLSIIFVYGLVRFLSLADDGSSVRLAGVFAYLAFTLVAAMISIQLGVRVGMEELIAESPEQRETLALISRSTRLVDMGLDVAWDLFIGTALVFLCFALGRHEQFGYRWGIPALFLGLLLIVLNVLTFPWPPADEGLVDVGPAIGLFIIALSTRLLQLGSRMSGRSA